MDVCYGTFSFMRIERFKTLRINSYRLVLHIILTTVLNIILNLVLKAQTRPTAPNKGSSPHLSVQYVHQRD